MSVQFGKWNFAGKPIDPQTLEDVRPVLAPYGPDGEGCICRDSALILHRAFHSTKESRREKQPFILNAGIVITWDGRLDNREELLSEIARGLSRDSTDLEIVAEAYAQWQTKAFAKLVGDWALSVWNPSNRSLILAKDFVGTRHLYYAVDKDEVTWCTVLDPLVLMAGHAFKLEEEYVAGWLSRLPAAHLTPYVGIHRVPPSSFVRFADGVVSKTRYWDFDPGQKLRYRTDTEYEEHFRFAFRESVRRRLRSDQPLLAELSGGMDSSAIVCMADTITTSSKERPVETISYYDDNEPNWNEKPYFTMVEQHRGRAGLHIDVGSRLSLSEECDERKFIPVPSINLLPIDAANRLSAHIVSKGIRALLCGIGGDEALGGVPTPIPELANLLAEGNLLRLAHQLKLWALNMRKPWLWILHDAIREFLPESLAGIPSRNKPPVWIQPSFLSQHRNAFLGYEQRLRLFRALPSFQENLRALDGLRRQLACVPLRKDPPCETLYPYLDRSLLEFLYAIPRDQLVRPGQRRSLMRRALVGIVPDDVLSRRRKAFVTCGPLKFVSREWSNLQLRKPLAITSFDFVDFPALSESFQKVRQGQEIRVAPILHLLILERWLRSLFRLSLIANTHTPTTRVPEPVLISAEKC